MRRVEKILREKVKRLEAELTEVRADRDKFREHFVRQFKFFLECLGDGSTPAMPRLVENWAKQLRQFKFWYW